MSAPDRSNIANDSALFSEHLSDTQPRRVKPPPPPPPPNPVPVVRTLRPPPEIWELVPVNEFKPVHSANRSSSSLGRPIIVAVVAGLLGAGIFYFWKLGSPQKDARPAPVTQAQAAAAPQSVAQESPPNQTTSSQAEVGATANQAGTSQVANPQPATPELSSTAPTHSAPGNQGLTRAAAEPKTADVKPTAGLNPTASLSGLELKKKATKKTEAAAA